MKLTHAETTAHLDGPRAPGPDELPMLSCFLNSVFRPRPSDRPIEEEYGIVYEQGNLHNVRIVRLEDRIVSSAGMWITDTNVGDVSIRIGGLNLVGTHRDFRRTGLATRVLNSCVEHLTNAGCHLAMLRSSLDGWYRKQGWESAGTKRLYHLDRGNRDLIPTIKSASIRHATPSDLNQITQLLDEFHLGANRSEQFVRQLLECKNTLTLLLERNRAIHAWVHGRATGIMEYHGSADDVLGLMGSFFDRFDDPNARTSSPRTDFTHATHHLDNQAPGFNDDITTALERIGIPAGRQYVAMWRILNLQALLTAYRDYGVTGCDKSDRIELEFDGRSSSYSRTQAVKALFGPERPDQFARSFAPLPIWQWETDIV